MVSAWPLRGLCVVRVASAWPLLGWQVDLHSETCSNQNNGKNQVSQWLLLDTQDVVKQAGTLGTEKCQLPKLKVAGSNPVSRSKKFKDLADAG